MKKYYYAYVVLNLVESFEKKLAKNKVEIIEKESAVSEKGEPIMYYTLKAEEGIIYPKWELKNLLNDIRRTEL